MWYLNLPKSVFKFIVVVFSLASCQRSDSFDLKITSETSAIDSLFLEESISKKVIFKIPISKSSTTISQVVNTITIGSVHFKDGKQGYLTILRPGKRVKMHIKADSSISTGHVEDSLLTYLWKSNNSFLADNGDFIFSTQSPDSLIALFNGFRLKRKAVIEKYSPILDSEVSDLLHFQNTARLYSFLFFYGRILKKLSPRNTFYDFVKQMETDSKWIKTFPSNTLYRYEVEYLKVHDAIKSIDSFLGFIEKQKIDQDHKDFLKSMYITDLIEKPFKFERHKDLLNSKSLRHVIQREKDNRYVSLIKRSAQLFFSIQHGEPAYNFTAETVTGKKVSLSDFEGKIVFIDNWASWCGPCIVERPKVLKMADKYSGNTNVTFLMISVDAKKSDWMNFLKNQGLSSHYGIDLIIENGMHSEYGKNYNIKFIPKYMLIDQKGFIINSNIHDLPSSVEKLINVNLKNR